MNFLERFFTAFLIFGLAGGALSSIVWCLDHDHLILAIIDTLIWISLLFTAMSYTREE